MKNYLKLIFLKQFLFITKNTLSGRILYFINDEK